MGDVEEEKKQKATSFPGPFPWFGGDPPPSQGKGPGNEVEQKALWEIA